MKHTNNPQEILDVLESGKNTFITGSAGAGKTYLVNKFAQDTDKNVLITATTGIAALNVGGDTIHRTLKLGIASRSFEAAKILGAWDAAFRRSPDLLKMWKAIDTIVIDEVSMLRRDQFELIDEILAHVKGNSAPFGGVQIVLVGDFLQLPPVVTRQDLSQYKDLAEPYCFQSDLWEMAGFESFNLTTVYRQQDSKFFDMLQKIRVGNITDDVDKVLKSKVGAKINLNVEPVKLFSHKNKVEKENIDCLKRLHSDVFLSEAEYTGQKYHLDALKKDCPADHELYFADGAQVMMITNDIDGKWVNGSIGIVDKATTDAVYVNLASGNRVAVYPHTWERKTHSFSKDRISTKTVASLRQYPFKLAYASTIHKSQGLTLDTVELDLSRCFTHGQAYVALSRVRSLEGLSLRGWDKKSVIVDPAVLSFYNL